MNIIWLDPGFGASGDMLLGAFVGLGAPLEAIRADLDQLGVDGWDLASSTTDRAGIAATKVDVLLADEPTGHPAGTPAGNPAPDRNAAHHHRSWSYIDGLLAEAALPEAVKTGARATFAALARVEAAIHQIDVDEVHFHEVGALDAIVDIVGAWSGLTLLDPAEVHAGPVGLGSGGTVGAAHGRLPVPAPATLSLLTDVPIKGLDTPAETVTPTGAALLTTMVNSWGPIPDGRLRGSARGAGGRNPETHPNVVSAVLVEPERVGRTATKKGPTIEHYTVEGTAVEAVVLATNLDDATAEVLGHTLERLLASGADDAWLIPIGMKKNRPGHELRVLCQPDLVEELTDIVFAETGTLGLRSTSITKHVLDRRLTSITVRGSEVAMKIGPHGAKPEHDDLVKLAATTNVPVRVLAAEAVRAYLETDE